MNGFMNTKLGKDKFTFQGSGGGVGVALDSAYLSGMLGKFCGFTLHALNSLHIKILKRKKKLAFYLKENSKGRKNTGVNSAYMTTFKSSKAIINTLIKLRGEHYTSSGVYMISISLLLKVCSKNTYHWSALFSLYSLPHLYSTLQGINII